MFRSLRSIASTTGVFYEFDNSKAKTLLGMQFMPYQVRSPPEGFVKEVQKVAEYVNGIRDSRYLLDLRGVAALSTLELCLGK